MKKVGFTIILAIFLFALPQVVSTSPGSEGTYVFKLTWGSWGFGDGEFDTPRGVAVDSEGNVYVADTNNDRIHKFDYSGGHLATWGIYGTGDGEFNEPYGVCVDSENNVYVADRRNNRIQKFEQKFEANGELLIVFLGWLGWNGVDDGWHGPDSGSTGTSGSGDGQFKWPRGVAVDSEGNVYVADTDNHRIQKFNSDGGFLGWIGLDNLGGIGWHGPGSGTTGKYGYGDGQFWFTGDVAVDSSGNVYVADVWNNRIQKFDLLGNFSMKWGSLGDGDGEFNQPWGVCVDSEDNIYVADTSNHRIQKFDANGLLLGWWGLDDDLDFAKWHDPGTGTTGIDYYYGSGDGELGKPDDMAVNSDGDIYVADTFNHRIQKIGLVPPLGVTSPNGGEGWIANTSRDITWDTGVSNADVRIDYSVDNGADWIEIIGETENNGSYNWTVPCNLSAECLVRISGLDDFSFDESDAVFTIKSETPPEITLIGLEEVVLECGIDNYTEYGATAVDGCGNDVPVDINSEDVDTMTCGTYEVTYNATDASGQKAVEKKRIVIVHDTTPPDPLEDSLQTVSGECSVEITDIPTANDNCAGTITGTPSAPLVQTGPTTYICTELGTHTVIWTYDDGNGNTATQEQTVIVKDETPPVPDSASLDALEGECSVEISDIPTATDDCTGSVIKGVPSAPLVKTEQGTYICTEQGTYTVTWTYTDESGNFATQPQTIKVEDVTPPTIMLSDPTCVDLNRRVNVNMLTISASDKCSSEVELVIDEVEIFNKKGHRVSGKGIYNIVKHKIKKKHHVRGKIIYALVENDIYVFPKGKDWSVCITATAIDESGNTKTEKLCQPLLQCNRWSEKMARLILQLLQLLMSHCHCW
jgi:hypothetical protein